MGFHGKLGWVGMNSRDSDRDYLRIGRRTCAGALNSYKDPAPYSHLSIASGILAAILEWLGFRKVRAERLPTISAFSNNHV